MGHQHTHQTTDNLTRQTDMQCPETRLCFIIASIYKALDKKVAELFGFYVSYSSPQTKSSNKFLNFRFKKFYNETTMKISSFQKKKKITKIGAFKKKLCLDRH